MITPLEIALLLLLGFAGLWVLKVCRSNIDPLSALKHFGPATNKPRPLRKEEREALFHAAIIQQKTAFGVLVLTVTIGALLSVALVSRIIFAPNLNLGLLGRATMLVGDLALCRFASRMNKDASARMMLVVETITTR